MAKPLGSASFSPLTLIELTQKNSSSDEVLDLGCGKGRHTLFLLSCGYAVRAVDRDGAALQELSKRAEKFLGTDVPV